MCKIRINLSVVIFALLAFNSQAIPTPPNDLTPKFQFLSQKVLGQNKRPLNSFAQAYNGEIFAANAQAIQSFGFGASTTEFAVLADAIVAANPVGKIYLGGNNQFGTIEARQFHSLVPQLPANMRQFGQIQQLIAMSQQIYFIAGKKLYGWSPAGLSAVLPLTSNRSKLFSIRGEAYLFDRNLSQIKQGQLQTVLDQTTLNGINIQFILPWQHEQWLIGSQTQGIFISEANNLRQWSNAIDEQLRNAELIDARYLPDGSSMIASKHSGLWILDANGKNLAKFDYPLGQTLLHSFVDMSATIWLSFDLSLVKLETSVQTFDSLATLNRHHAQHFWLNNQQYTVLAKDVYGNPLLLDDLNSIRSTTSYWDNGQLMLIITLIVLLPLYLIMLWRFRQLRVANQQLQHQLSQKTASNDIVTIAQATAENAEPETRPSDQVSLPTDNTKSSAKSSTKTTIVVIEDNQDLRNYIVTEFAQSYQVYSAEDGLSGLKLIEHKLPDLIVSDIAMPNMDGLQLCQKVKSSKLLCHIPVILLTAQVDRQQVIDGLAAGANDYLTKPFDCKELLLRVANQLTLCQQQRALRQQQLLLPIAELPTATPDDEFIKKTMLTIEQQHHHSYFGVDELASQMALSRRQLLRKLKGITGQSPTEIIRDFRLQCAAAKIRLPGSSIAQVAYAVGFESAAHFSRAFKSQFGVSPSQYNQEFTTSTKL